MKKLIDEGDKLMNKGKINDAIEKFTSALIYANKAPITNFKLSKLYSINQDSKNSFYYLEKAVQDGFNNFDVINKDRDLSFIRALPAYKTFASNGYKSLNTQTEDLNSISKIEVLEKLTTLLDKGILSKEEFEIEKKKILYPVQ